MIAKWLLQSLIWVAAMGALLLVPAGTLHWPAAWVFLATMAFIALACGAWLARTDPARFRLWIHKALVSAPSLSGAQAKDGSDEQHFQRYSITPGQPAR